MKVLHILNYVGRGGSESYIKNLISSSSEIVYELMYNVDGGGLDDFKALGVKTVNCKMKSFLDINAAKFLKNYVKENNIDLVHTHFMRENGICFLSKVMGLKVPVINTRHMVTKISKKAELLNKIFFSKNKYIFAVSSLVKSRLIDEGVDGNKIIVLPPPIPIMGDVKKVKKEKNEKWIISVGRLSEEKGILFFIEALKELFKKIDNTKAIIIGYGDLENQIKDLIKEYNLEDKIEMLGYKPKPFDYLMSSDLYVNHSKEEAFGLSIVEAAYSNTPLLITRNCGAVDYFNEENKSALTYEYWNIDEFVEKALEILNNESISNNLVENANSVLDNNLSQSKIIEIIEDKYKGAILENEKN